MSTVHKHIAFDHISTVYFLGIGGIGMSALARYFALKGIEVYGYDKTATTLTKQLEQEGMIIHYDERPDLIPEAADLIVYTPAIPADHAEWATLRAMKVPIMKRAQALGVISKAFNTIAVAGTHGKTSTSSMTSYFLREAGLEVSAFLGGIVKDYQSNFVFGKSDWIVVEADEFDRSFMHLEPNIAVLLSMDADHLDIYGDHGALKQSFKDFTLQIQAGGTLLVAAALVEEIDADWRIELLKKDIKLYSFGIDTGWYNATDLQAADHSFEFDFNIHDSKQLRTSIAMPGQHNISNATAALAVADQLGLDMSTLAQAIPSFNGILRRFDYQIKQDDCVYIDDYAHHPTEIAAAIDAARTLYPNRELTVIFQPHLYTRTRDFMEGFAQALSEADKLVLMDIYPARELPIEGIESARIAELITNKEVQVVDQAGAIEYVLLHAEEIEVLMTLGAGDIDRLVEPIGDILKEIKH